MIRKNGILNVISLEKVCLFLDNGKKRTKISYDRYEGKIKSWYFCDDDDSIEDHYVEVYVTSETILRIYSEKIDVLYSGCIMREALYLHSHEFDSVNLEINSMIFQIPYLTLRFENE